MNDQFVVIVDPALSIVASLRGLACSEPRDADVWLHSAPPPNGSEFVFFLITLWHVCSLLQPDLVQHGVDATRRPPLASSLQGLSSPPDSFQRLASASTSAWSSHPMHVAVLTSHASGDPLRARLHQRDSTIRSDAVIATRAYASVQDTGGGGGGGSDSGNTTCIDIAWGVDSNSATLDDHLVCGSAWYAAWTSDDRDGSADGETRIRTVRDAALFETSAHHDGQCLVIGAVPVLAPHSGSLDGLDDACACLGQWQGAVNRRRAPADRPSSWNQTTTDLHEAGSVGVIVKALVQQNAGASLLLRTIMYVAALLYCVHSMLVLGERPWMSKVVNEPGHIFI